MLKNLISTFKKTTENVQNFHQNRKKLPKNFPSLAVFKNLPSLISLTQSQPAVIFFNNSFETFIK